MNQNDETKHLENALIFIPDISGFTDFVSNTDITHARHIIEELLNAIINENDIGLEVSEIEGDAILFFRKGKAPTTAELLVQIQKMFIAFHSHLRLYESQRICQCGACVSANALQLKFIAHYGEVTEKHVNQFTKLFGKEVIVAHRLLKNEISGSEYALFTDELVNACSTWVDLPTAAWDTVHHVEDAEYDFGKCKYCYIDLNALKKHIPEIRIEDFAIKGKVKQVAYCKNMIHAPLELVFDMLADLSIRHYWMEGPVDSVVENGAVTHQGSIHRCVMNKREDPVIASYDFVIKDQQISFSETDTKSGMTISFLLKKISPSLTQIETAGFLKHHFIKSLIIDLFMKKKIGNVFQGNDQRFKELCEKQYKSGEPHSLHIQISSAA